MPVQSTPRKKKPWLGVWSLSFGCFPQHWWLWSQVSIFTVPAEFVSSSLQLVEFSTDGLLVVGKTTPSSRKEELAIFLHLSSYASPNGNIYCKITWLHFIVVHHQLGRLLHTLGVCLFPKELKSMTQPISLWLFNAELREKCCLTSCSSSLYLYFYIALFWMAFVIHFQRVCSIHADYEPHRKLSLSNFQHLQNACLLWINKVVSSMTENGQ